MSARGPRDLAQQVEGRRAVRELLVANTRKVHDLWLAGVDSDLREDGHQPLGECVELLLGVPDLADAKVAIGGVEKFLQVVERQRFVHGERAQYAQAKTLMDEPV